ncbi:hypothetical protein [Halorubrum salipaludis]|uniref:hypothetical protein n=1 Tax=Halorubrum salipaludis TaxID=2032630 RepID=UPI0011819E24|nr:hypothetical protein [Halorubrum salipaludis]
MRRRTILAVLGSNVLLAGCIEKPSSANESAEGFTESHPDECPVSHDYNVPLPEDTTVSEARSFVKDYEREYVTNHLIETDDEKKSLGTEPSSTVRVVDTTDDSIVVHVETTWSIITEMDNGEGVSDNMESAWYYIDERVIRRTGDPNQGPANGDLMECIPVE